MKNGFLSISQDDVFSLQESMQEEMQQTVESSFRMVSVAGMIVPLIAAAIFIAVIIVIIRSVISHGKATKRVFDLAEDAVRNGAQRVSVAPGRIRTPENRTEELLPLICEDFPGFSWEETRARTKNAVRAVLLARTTANPSLLPEEASEELKKQLALELADDKAGGAVPKYGDIEPGEGVISSYARRNGFCVVTVQVAVRCRKWSEQEGRVVSGSRDRAVDTVFSAELILIKDPALAAERGCNLICPSCGSRITDLKATVCEYCGRPRAAVNVWQFGEIRELR